MRAKSLDGPNRFVVPAGPGEWPLYGFIYASWEKRREPVPWFLHLVADEPKMQIKKNKRDGNEMVPGYNSCKIQ